MNILALDLANKTGWAHSSGLNGVEFFGFMADEAHGCKMNRFAEWMRSLPIGQVSVDLVALERAHHRGWGATLVAIGMFTVVEQWAAMRGIETRTVHTSTLKKHATGTGRAKKPEIMQAAANKWPEVTIIDDNHADALWLLDYAEKELI